MRFTQLKVGKRFTLPRENNANIYVKINENKHNNCKDAYKGYLCSIHGCTQVKENK